MISIQTNAKYAGKIHSLYIAANQEDAFAIWEMQQKSKRRTVFAGSLCNSPTQMAETGIGDEVFSKSEITEEENFKSLAALSLIIDGDLK